MSLILHNFRVTIRKVVASQVTAKLEQKGLKASGFLGRAATFAANKVVTDEKVVTNLTTTVIEKIKSGVTEMGINADVSNVITTIILAFNFMKNNFVPQ